MRLAICIAAVLLSACEPPTVPDSNMDQCLRRETFERCLASVPNGPQASKYNDWSEVIDECSVFARESSYRHPSQITPACRSGW